MTTKQPIHFSKMHGLGNDFVVINTIAQPFDVKQFPIQALAQRHTGIGFDQLLLIEPATQADFFCRIFNADGSEAEQCGNGLRCIARFVHESGLHKKPELTLATKAGRFAVHIHDYEHIQVEMGVPVIQNPLTKLTLNHGDTVSASILSLGNPHALVKVDNITETEVALLGASISAHEHFAQGANVGFMQVLNPTHIKLRTFERGAGETLACGSNACAAAVAGIMNNWLQPLVTVECRTGKLQIEWQGENKSVLQTGPATRVFMGEYQST